MGQPCQGEPADEAKGIEAAGLHTWLILDAYGSEVHPAYTCRCGTLPAQAARLVSSLRARSAVAPHPRSVSHPRVGGDAAADAGGTGDRVLPALPGRVPHGAAAGRSTASPSARGLGRIGVLPPRGQPAPP